MPGDIARGLAEGPPLVEFENVTVIRGTTRVLDSVHAFPLRR